MRSRQLIVLITATMLGGCGYFHEFHTPAIETPAKWSASEAAAKEWPSADWWKQFSVPALDTLMAQAQTDNTDIAAAVARVREADAQARIAGAPLLPTIDANAGVNREHIPISPTATSVGGTAIQRNSYTATLNASYEVDFWGKNWALRNSALSLAKASRFDRDVITLTTQAAIATSYFEVQSLQERLAIAKDNAINADEILRVLRERNDAGIAPPLDLAQQESLTANAHAAVPPLVQQLGQAQNALALLAGKLPEGFTVDTVTLDKVTLPPVVPGLPSELLARRPDVAEAEAQLAAADADLTAARAAFLPSIDLTGEYGFESLALSSLLKPGSTLFTLAGSVTQPIFEPGLLIGGLEFARARRDELTQNYRKAVLSAFTDVENALIAVQQTQEAEKAQAQAEATSQKAYDIAQQQFHGGIADITGVLDTQKTLFAARDAHAQATLARINATVGLFKALGGGWQTGHEEGEIKPVETPKPASDTPPPADKPV